MFLNINNKQALLLLISFIALLIYSCSYLPENVNLDPNIIYRETPEYISLSSNESDPDIMFLFLPGGLVDPHAYLTLLERIALDSIHVLVPKFTSNLAILELSKYRSLLDAFPEKDSWYIGGHSLGGIAAISAVMEEPDKFKGLILLGAYPSDSFAISDWNRSVLSIYAENDQLSTVEEIEGATEYLPAPSFINDPNSIDTLDLQIPRTIYYLISGGNHSQFGDYGFQKGDGQASIDMESQHEHIYDAINRFIIKHENE